VVDTSELVEEVAPAVKAAIRSHHTAALVRGADSGGDTTAVGSHILQAIYRRTPHVRPLKEAVDDLASRPDSVEAAAALRFQIDTALSEDGTLYAEVARLVHGEGNALGDGAGSDDRSAE
jgi:hypothetical protein